MFTGVVSRMGNTRSGSKPGPRSPSWRRAVVRSLAAAPAHGGKDIAWQRSVKSRNPPRPAPQVNLDGKAIGLNIARAGRVTTSRESMRPEPEEHPRSTRGAPEEHTRTSPVLLACLSHVSPTHLDRKSTRLNSSHLGIS